MNATQETERNTLIRLHIKDLQQLMAMQLDASKKLEIAGKISEAIGFMESPGPVMPTVGEIGQLLAQAFEHQADVRKQMAAEQQLIFDKNIGGPFVIRNACSAAAAERAKLIVAAKSPAELVDSLRHEMRSQLAACSDLRVLSAQLRALEVAGTTEATAERHRLLEDIAARASILAESRQVFGDLLGESSIEQLRQLQTTASLTY